MGNSHPNVTKSQRKKLGRQRRLSDPSKNCHHHHLHDEDHAGSSTCPASNTPPTIQINGEESFDDINSSEAWQLRTKSASTDFTKFVAKPMHASARRKIFLTSNNNSIARSLDDSMTAKMSSLHRAKSHSPLKQMRTYSFRSMSSEENLIDKECCDLLTESWRLVESRAASSSFPGSCFGFFVLRRVFVKIPALAKLFGVEQGEDIEHLEEQHPARRHAKLLTNILNISVKSVDELELQVAPTVFKYGERHYRPDISPHMTEENVRIFCAQIVCTVFDFLTDAESTPKCAESWIELMRYLGQKLLDGHEFAKLTAEKKISINRNDHHLFLML